MQDDYDAQTARLHDLAIAFYYCEQLASIDAFMEVLEAVALRDEAKLVYFLEGGPF